MKPKSLKLAPPETDLNLDSSLDAVSSEAATSSEDIDQPSLEVNAADSDDVAAPADTQSSETIENSMAASSEDTVAVDDLDDLEETSLGNQDSEAITQAESLDQPFQSIDSPELVNEPNTVMEELVEEPETIPTSPEAVPENLTEPTVEDSLRWNQPKKQNRHQDDI